VKYEWETVRREAIKAFRGEFPHASTEEEILRVFEQEPLTVQREVAEIAEAIASGKPIRSAWAVLRARLTRLGGASRNVTVDDGSERDKAVLRARNWIGNAGLIFDRRAEIEHELFGTAIPESTLAAGEIEHFRGAYETRSSAPLFAWRDDDRLRGELVALWEESRPAGELIELEADQRAARFREIRARLAEMLREEREAAELALVEVSNV
jgi:hypothetical protein